PPVALEGEVVFSCLKGAEDGNGLALRVFNPSPEPTTARLMGPVTVERVRLDETGESAVASDVVEVAPSEIATLRLLSAAPA
ncbi:MAG TPA: glycosyl hydrolase-related protein, partial [Solirubrobacteraceae bacterium]